MNAVKTQIWIAVSTYVLVAIIQKKLGLDHLSLYNILEVLSVSLFCYVDLSQLFREVDFESGDYNNPNQLQLFNL